MTPDERAERIHYHEYSGEGITEHAERIVVLEELVLDMLRTLGPPALRVDEIECGTIYAAHIHAFEDRLKELGVAE